LTSRSDRNFDACTVLTVALFSMNEWRHLAISDEKKTLNSFIQITIQLILKSSRLFLITTRLFRKIPKIRPQPFG